MQNILYVLSAHKYIRRVFCTVTRTERTADNTLVYNVKAQKRKEDHAKVSLVGPHDRTGEGKGMHQVGL